jgi:nucleotide-binding universal stress UspA family protein
VDFVKLFDAELFLIYVVEPIIYPADFSLGQVAIPSIDIDMQKKAEDELNSLAKQFIKNNLKYKVVIKTGKPFVEINEYAREQDIDMIIMATHGHTGVEHLLFGSTAEKVVRKAPCPVLTLREPIKGFSYKN